jgi:hypothetical protein
VADDPTIKGKGKDGACMDYDLAPSSSLAASGIHGQLIFYRWHIRNTAIEGSHVFVVLWKHLSFFPVSAYFSS